MSKKLLENTAAEKEANDIGMRYMNSSDVLGDMKRDYGSALDGVRVHDDAAANARVAAARRDGLASGKDIYMRSGSLSSSAPEVKGLLAHEVAHTMQQSGGETHESIDYGSEQGGFFDLFKKFGDWRKRKNEEKAIIKQYHLEEADSQTKKDAVTAYRFFNNPSKEAAMDPAIQEAVRKTFISGASAQMKKRGDSAQQQATALRDSTTVGVRPMSVMLQMMMSDDVQDSIYQTGAQGMQGVNEEVVSELISGKNEGRKQELREDGDYGLVNDVTRMDDITDLALPQIEGLLDDPNSQIGSYLASLQPVFDFEGSKIDNPDEQSASLMNFFMNRVVTPNIYNRAATEKDPAQKKKMLSYSRWLLQDTSFTAGEGITGKKREGFLKKLKGKFRG